MRNRFVVAGVIAGAMIAGTVPAHANCQAEVQPIIQQRETAGAAVKRAIDRRDPAGACTALRRYVSVEQRFLDYMRTNKDWCQIPDQLIDQVTEAVRRAGQSRDQACTVARRVDQQRAAAAAARPPGGGGGGPTLGDTLNLRPNAASPVGGGGTGRGAGAFDTLSASPR